MTKIEASALEAAWSAAQSALRIFAPNMGLIQRTAIMQVVVAASLPAYLSASKPAQEVEPVAWTCRVKVRGEWTPWSIVDMDPNDWTWLRGWEAVEGAPLYSSPPGQSLPLEQVTRERDEAPHGYVYFNPDTGMEFSTNHPVESGEVDDAEDIRPATEFEAGLVGSVQTAEARSAALSKQLQDALEALKPFASVANWPGMEVFSDDYQPEGWDVRPSLGDYRRARTLTERTGS